LRVRVAAPGGALTLLNTHLDATGDDVWRMQEIATVLRVARESGRGPLLLGGDFNAPPESAIHAELRAAGFRDAWPECGEGDAMTFPVTTPVKRIDYLYLTGAARCASARVLPSDASDHRALLVKLRLR
ncbi:MAG: endonuclease/exonuclease/phosphatase family protein, partial [Gemmatimonadetes bacterium]|nr:endonuclease/exonuclease/phosphatase family protein [Gemmatimonadota bacterium]